MANILCCEVRTLEDFKHEVDKIPFLNTVFIVKSLFIPQKIFVPGRLQNAVGNLSPPAETAFSDIIEKLDCTLIQTRGSL